MRLNKTKQKKDFWDMSWNPVWGCLNTCNFCYARRIAKRHAEQIAKKETKKCKDNNMYLYILNKLIGFKPTWLESNYVRQFPRKPSIIFVNSMSDPAYWEQEWYERIIQKIAENMQHTFVVLTKQPEVYERYTFPHNTIIGFTVNTNIQMDNILSYINYYKYINKVLISIEPIQEKIEKKVLFYLEDLCDWLHVGQESGNRADRIRATREIIEPFFDLKDIPVFMKNNLEGICGDRPLRKESIYEMGL